MMRFGIAVAAVFTASSAVADDAADWPYPDDIPVVGPVELSAAGTWPPDIVRLLMIRGIGAAQLSPDGETLAYRSSVSGEPQLWTVNASGGWPRQLTFAGAVSSHSWTPDGSDLLYGADREGDERLGLTLISAAGTQEKTALPYSDAFVVPGDFSSDGGRLAYATTRRNGVDFDIHVLDLETGEDYQALEGTFGYFVDGWRPGHEQVLISETRGEDGNDLHLLDLESGELITLFAPEVSSAYDSASWLPDGSGFYLVTDQDREHRAVGFVDADALTTIEMIHSPEHDIDNVEVFGSGAFYAYTENVGGYSSVSVVNRSSGDALEAPEGLPAGVYSIDGASAAPVLAITVRGPRAAGDVYVWNVETGDVTLAAEAELAGVDISAFVEPESLFFEASDGVQLNGLLYMPTDVSGGPPPVVVDVHGGPTAQARPSFSAVTQYLVAQGVAVFDLNFRGSTGFGKTFARLDNQMLRHNAVRDVADAVAWLGETGRVDADRAAVMGGSYGGYLTNAVVGEYPDAFKAGVSFVGVSDWVRALETASPALKASDQIEYGDISDPDVRAYHADLSPINDVADITAAMMVLHGANDPRDPVEESDAFVEALRENGAEVEYLRFPDEGHGIRKRANRVAAYRRVAEFLTHTLDVNAGEDE